jgi:hypothetical protein
MTSGNEVSIVEVDLVNGLKGGFGLYLNGHLVNSVEGSSNTAMQKAFAQNIIINTGMNISAILGVELKRFYYPSAYDDWDRANWDEIDYESFSFDEVGVFDEIEAALN